MMTKPIKTLELHYQMIQFLIIKIIIILLKYMMENIVYLVTKINRVLGNVR